MTEATIANPTDPNAQTLPILEASEYDKYMLRAPAEVMLVLRGLRDRMAQITVYCNEGQDMLLTVLVTVANDHLIFDVSADEELNRRVATAAKHYCVTQLDKVRIQFLLGEFARITYEGRPALITGMPRELLRLQRREFYRLTTPIARPLKCRMSLPLSGAGEYAHEATVFDISGGGIGISAPPDGVPFALDQQVSNCRIELPEVGLVTCAVKVCNFHEIALKSGTHVKRAGCEFIKLPGPMATLVQRYIIKVERERKARESGLGF